LTHTAVRLQELPGRKGCLSGVLRLSSVS